MIDLINAGVCFRRFRRHDRVLNRFAYRAWRRLGAAAGAHASAPPVLAAPAFWALREISLHIDPGECVGVIGVNGAGKTTLMQLLAGIYQPSAGTVQVNGEVTALLTLNTGFNNDMSGRENIRLRGILLGLARRQIDALTPEVIAFADLGDFIDEPVRTYSTGMRARLGFAINMAVVPDVLLIDEGLTAGDGAFAQRSKTKINEVIGAARIVCICTHDLQIVREMCPRVLWLHAGELRQDGNCGPVVSAYEQFLTTLAALPQPETV